MIHGSSNFGPAVRSRPQWVSIVVGKLASQMIERVRGRLMEKILGQEEEHA